MSILYNEIAEQELLGALLLDNDLLLQIEGLLEHKHFGNKTHALIYVAICNQINKLLPANPKSIYIVLENCEPLQELGGLAYLEQLAIGVTSLRNIKHFAQLIHELAVKRSLIDLSTMIENHLISEQASVAECIADIENKIFSITENKFGYSFKSLEQATVESLGLIEKAFKNKEHLGLDTNFYDLDNILGGLYNSDLIILAGRPAMGKTALATSIAYNIARNYKISHGTKGAVVAFFSLEMSTDQLVARLLSEMTKISSHEMRKGRINQEIFQQKLVPAATELRTIPIYIDDTPCISIEQMASRACRLKKTQNIGLIIVDYLQLMQSGHRRRYENRVLEISEITQGLKSIAKNLNIPVLALSQLSRNVESRDDKKPQLSDLRESGSIEQDADVVMFVYREEYYLSSKQPALGTVEHEKWKLKMESILGVAEIIIGKQRHGPTGVVKLKFEPKYTSFKNLGI